MFRCRESGSELINFLWYCRVDIAILGYACRGTHTSGMLLAALPPQQPDGYQLVGTRYPTLWFKFSNECRIDLGSAQLGWVQKL